MEARPLTHRRAIAMVVLAAVSAGACGGGTPTANQKAAAADLERALEIVAGRRSYHVTTFVDIDEPLREAVSGRYEIDIELPDRQRSVRYLGASEAGRAVRVGERVFLSSDRGRTWQRAPEEVAAHEPTAGVIDRLRRPCRVTGEERLRVEVRSKVNGCNAPLQYAVELRHGLLSRVQARIPTDAGIMTIDARFDFRRTVPAITPPPSENDEP